MKKALLLIALCTALMLAGGSNAAAQINFVSKYSSCENADTVLIKRNAFYSLISVTGYDKKRDMYTLRSYWNAPDDIDGNIYFYSAKKHHEGDVVKVMINSAMVYDLIGEETN